MNIFKTKRLFTFIIIFVITLLLPTNITVFSEETEVINKESETDLQLEALKNATEKKISEYPELLKEGYTPYEVGNVKMKDGWAFLNVFSVDANPPEKYDLIDSGTYLMIGQEKEEKSWEVGIMDNLCCFFTLI